MDLKSLPKANLTPSLKALPKLPPEERKPNRAISEDVMVCAFPNGQVDIMIPDDRGIRLDSIAVYADVISIVFAELEYEGFGPTVKQMAVPFGGRTSEQIHVCIYSGNPITCHQQIGMTVGLQGSQTMTMRI